MVSFFTLLIMLSGQGILFKATMAKLTLANFVVLVVLSGFHLLETHCEAKKPVRIIVWGLGIILLIFGILVAYNVIDYTASWNHLIGFGIVYVTIIQMQLLKWEKSKALLKVFGLITLLSNIILTAYFMAKINMSSFGIVVDIAVISSVFAFLFGMILTWQKKSNRINSEA